MHQSQNLAALEGCPSETVSSSQRNTFRIRPLACGLLTTVTVCIIVLILFRCKRPIDLIFWTTVQTLSGTCRLCCPGLSEEARCFVVCHEIMLEVKSDFSLLQSPLI